MEAIYEPDTAVLDPRAVVEPSDRRGIAPDIDHIVTEDDTPVDNFASEVQQRLLVEPLKVGWRSPRRFIAAANVGVFSTPHRPPIVPDMFLSLGVKVPQDWWAKKNRSYFMWEFGKPPDVVVEIVSNKRGGETRRKLREYAEMGVSHYVIYDPQLLIQRVPLQIYERHGSAYVPVDGTRLEQVGLGLTLWDGEYEGRQDRWLRWTDLRGRVIPTGAEEAERERKQTERERQRAERAQEHAEREHERANAAERSAEQARERVESERARAERAELKAHRLAERLRALGLDVEPEGPNGST